MGSLDDLVKGSNVRYGPETGTHTDRLAPTDDDMDGRPEDAFRTRRGSHCLLLHASDGTIQWFPYPANDRGLLSVKGDVITLEFSAAAVTIKGSNLMPLVLALADYRAASVRVAKETPGCKTAVERIVIE